MLSFFLKQGFVHIQIGILYAILFLGIELSHKALYGSIGKLPQVHILQMVSLVLLLQLLIPLLNKVDVLVTHQLFTLDRYLLREALCLSLSSLIVLDV